MTNTNEKEEVHIPDVRSHNNATKGPQPKGDPSFDPGDKVRMKNPSTGIFDWIMKVKKAVFNEERWGWNYEVTDSDGIKYDKMVPEPDLEDG
ncbi:hypothetical protein MMC34_004246 [Xylographa carneopallida]|nr:hypothetical protein [Xylographa carneopallida]